MRFFRSGVGAFVVCGFAIATLAAVQQSSTEATVSGCLQRAPSTMAKDGRFVLMNASISPLGGSGAQDVQPAAPPPEPSRGDEPVQRHTEESDARRQTGGVSFLLQGGHDLDSTLESKIGQRVEVTGTVTGTLHVPPTRLSAEQPMQKLRIKRIRAITPAC